MLTDKENISIAKHMRDYASLVQAEAEKLELLGVETLPSLFDKAQEIHFLAERVAEAEKIGLKLIQV